MSKTTVPALLMIGGCLLAGCVVRSIYPWLPEDTKVTDISLDGTWHDGKEDKTAFFTSGSETNYQVLLVSGRKDVSRFTATLHRISGRLLLVVGPEDKDELGAFATLPGYLLFKVQREDDTLRLFPLNLDSFEARLQRAKPQLLANGDKKKGFVLLSPTPELAAFVTAQLKDNTLFDAAPMYTFTRVADE